MSRVCDDQFLGEELARPKTHGDTARFEVVPCGLEATVSYGTGTAQGPRRLSPRATSLKGWFMMPSRVARAFSPIRP